MKKGGFGKFLVGVAIGAGIGILFAPKSGKETREDIKKKCDELIDKAKNLNAEDVKKAITKKANEIKKGLKELDKEKVLKIAKEKAKALHDKAEDLYILAKEKGTPVLEKTAADLKHATAEALKKIAAKLEN
jgi:gas vesicle protein